MVTITRQKRKYSLYSLMYGFYCSNYANKGSSYSLGEWLLLYVLTENMKLFHILTKRKLCAVHGQRKSRFSNNSIISVWYIILHFRINLQIGQSIKRVSPRIIYFDILSA